MHKIIIICLFCDLVILSHCNLLVRCWDKIVAMLFWKKLPCIGVRSGFVIRFPQGRCVHIRRRIALRISLANLAELLNPALYRDFHVQCHKGDFANRFTNLRIFALPKETMLRISSRKKKSCEATTSSVIETHLLIRMPIIQTSVIFIFMKLFC